MSDEIEQVLAEAERFERADPRDLTRDEQLIPRLAALVREQQAQLNARLPVHAVRPMPKGMTCGSPHPVCMPSRRWGPMTSDLVRVTCEACVIILEQQARIAELTTWRPMSEAPQDGTEIILRDIRPHMGLYLAAWTTNEYGQSPGWYVVHENADNVLVGHDLNFAGWLPLPAIPKAEVGE